MAAPERPPQFVLLAFDGSKNIDFWQESRDFAAANDVRFTYFMSGVYFLLDGDKNQYVEPQHGKGKSNIGWGGTSLDVMKSRLQQVKKAMEEGHEMASHANAHFDGSGYSEAQWDSEFDQFTSIMSTVWQRYDKKNEPAGWVDYFSNGGVIGFRAPLLGVSAGLWETIKSQDFMYDTSRIDKMTYWPQRVSGDGFWNFPLAGLPVIGEDGKIKKKSNGNDLTTLSMDYNFYVTQSKGIDGGSANHKRYENEMYNSYINYFNKNYYGNRAPIHIGHHFSKWNGGAYWKAMQRFAKSVCAQPEVVCGTYKELVEFVNKNKANIADYQKGNFSNGAMKSPAGLIPVKVTRDLGEAELEELRNGPRDNAEAHIED